jgi:hypothetical protein
MIPTSSLAKEESDSDNSENDDHDDAKIKKRKIESTTPSIISWLDNVVR